VHLPGQLLPAKSISAGNYFPQKAFPQAITPLRKHSTGNYFPQPNLDGGCTIDENNR